jgi:hypothetical protein
MDIASYVQSKRRAGRQILFSRDSEFLQGLLIEMEAQSHRTLVLWALDMAERAVQALEAERPDETRPREALSASSAWARGEVKMPVAKRAILAAHAAAKEAGDARLAALMHAEGQACATVHVKTHAPGFIFYDLTALARSEPLDRLNEAVPARIGFYLKRLEYWRDRSDEPERKWAKFLKD